MPATIRIDFDVNASSISEALQKELAKVQGVVSSANAAIEAAKGASNTKMANEAIKEAQRVAKAAIKEEEQIVKEKEKQDAYLMRVRMNSIKAANAAEMRADKEAAAAKLKEEEKIAAHKEHRRDMTKEIIGIGAAVEGFKLLTEKAEEATAANKRLQTGTGLTGEALEAQGKIAEALGDKFAVGGDKAKDTMGKVAYYTHASGEELKRQTEAALAYEAGTGKDAARKLATEKGRAELMMNLAANTAKAQKAANEPAVQAQYIQTKLMETIGQLAVTVLTALGPALKVVMPIVSQLGDLLGNILKPIIDALAPIITTVGETFKQLTPIITGLISEALEIVTPILSSIGDLLKELIPPIIGVVKAIVDSMMPVFKALQPVINEVIEIFKQMFEEDMNTYIGILTDVFVPLIRDLVAPILLELIPVIKLIADLFRDYAVPAIKILSGVMGWLMTNIVQPLIKFFGKGLVDAIHSVVDVVMKAIEAVKSITNALGSLLGLGGDKAVAATQVTGKKVVAIQEETNQKIEQQQDFHYDNIEKKQKKHHEKKIKERKDYTDKSVALFKQEEKEEEKVFKELESAWRDVFKRIHDRKMNFIDSDSEAALYQLELAKTKELKWTENAEKAYQDAVYKIKHDAIVKQIALSDPNSDGYKALLDTKLKMEREFSLHVIDEQRKVAAATKRGYAEQISGAQSVFDQLMTIQGQSHQATAQQKVDSLLKAGSAMVEMVANVLANSAELGPFGVLTAPGTIAAALAMYEAAKTTFGFEQGGFTGYGKHDAPAGVVHKNEFVLKAGSFAVDSNGNLVSVAGVGGNQAAVVGAITKQTEVLSKQMGQSTVINQNRMVLENYRVERSRSRESV